MKNWSVLSHLPVRELKELQDRKLRYFISRQLYPFSPHYHRLFNQHKINPKYIRAQEDLRIIPFTKKDDLLPAKDNPRRFIDFILQPDKNLIKKYGALDLLLKLALLKAIKGEASVKEKLEKEYRPIFMTATTGTTNQPVSFFYSHYDLENLKIYGYRLLEVFGARGDIRGVNLFPYAPHLAFWQTVFAGMAHNNFMLSTGGGKVMGTLGNIEAIVKVQPSVLAGEPNFLYHLVRSAKEQGRDFGFVRKIALGASRVPLGFKKKLTALLKGMGARHIRIMGTYGFTEAKCAWGECPTALGISSGYHTYPDKEIFEIVDPVTGEAKGEGEDGELVYTNIDARGSCVLRYRTGDLVKGGITYKMCPHCKRTVPRISSDISRASHIKDLMLSKVKGTLVNLNDINSILESEKGIDEWQIEIRKKNNDPYEVDEFIVYLSLDKGVDAQGQKNALNAKIKAQTEITPNEIIILPHNQMIDRVEMEVSHKAKRLVDKRPNI